MTAEARRSQILDVTHAIVDTEGFHAATPNRIAREAGINRSLLYQQFGDPAGLFVALIDREAARAGAQFAEVIAETAEPGGEGDLVSRFDSVVKAADACPAYNSIVGAGTNAAGRAASTSTTRPNIRPSPAHNPPGTAPTPIHHTSTARKPTARRNHRPRPHEPARRTSRRQLSTSLWAQP